MRAVLQRVSSAEVKINGGETRKIGQGLMVLLGVGQNDTREIAEMLAIKTAALRIFEDADEKMNLSAESQGYSALVVSNFTLYADCKKGRRPSFVSAAPPSLGEELYLVYLRKLGELLPEVQSGEFGADMLVSIQNDGPVTIILDSEELF